MALLVRHDGDVEILSVTVGLPVKDLSHAVPWYRRALGLAEPDLQPAAGVVEFQVGPIWLQLSEEATDRSGAETVTRFGVTDADAERARLVALAVPVGPIERVPGVVTYFNLVDPDGNVLSLYSEG